MLSPLSCSRCLRFWVSFSCSLQLQKPVFLQLFAVFAHLIGAKHVCFDALNVLLDALGIKCSILLVWSVSYLSDAHVTYRSYGQLRQIQSTWRRNHKECINWQWSPKSFGFSGPLPQADDVLSRKTRQTRLLWLASQKFDPSKFSKQRTESNSDVTSPSVLHFFLENSWSDNLSYQTCITFCFCRTSTFSRQVKISGLHHVVHEICAHPANTNIINRYKQT